MKKLIQRSQYLYCCPACGQQAISNNDERVLVALATAPGIVGTGAISRITKVSERAVRQRLAAMDGNYVVRVRGKWAITNKGMSAIGAGWYQENAAE